MTRYRHVDRFRNSRIQLWVFGGAAVALCVMSMFMFGAAAIPVVAASVPSICALAVGQTWAANRAEAMNPQYYFEEDLPDEEPHRTRRGNIP